MHAYSSLQLKAYDYIKNLILTHKLSIDTLYSETKISKEIGISRTPIRDALRCLSQDGYITIIPSKGFMIRSLSSKAMRETIQIRCAIEGFCTHIIASEINADKARATLEQMDQALENQKKAVQAQDDYEGFMHYDHAFHLLIVNYIENEETNRIFQRLMYLIHLTTRSSLAIEGRVNGTLDEHAAYADLLKRGDGPGAYRILMEHLMKPLELLHPET